MTDFSLIPPPPPPPPPPTPVAGEPVIAAHLAVSQISITTNPAATLVVAARPTRQRLRIKSPGYDGQLFYGDSASVTPLTGILFPKPPDMLDLAFSGAIYAISTLNPTVLYVEELYN